MASVFSKIDRDDYNTIQSTVASIMGTGAGTNGYGQPFSSDQVAEGDQITVNEYANLVYDLTNISRHQSGSVPTFAEPEEGDKIKYNLTTEPIDQYLGLANQYFIDRFNIDASYRSITALADATSGVTVTQKTWPNASQDAWKYVQQVEVTVSWTTSEHARHFFNSGGKILFTSTRTGGTTSGGTNTIANQNNSWSTLLDGNARLEFAGNSSTGSVDGSQFFRLGNTYSSPFVNITDTGAYTTNAFKIYAKSDVSNNNLGTARTLTFLIQWIDSHQELGIDAPDGVDGTLSLYLECLKPSQALVPAGSGNWTVVTPIVNYGTISGGFPSIDPNQIRTDVENRFIVFPSRFLAVTPKYTVIGSPQEGANSGDVQVWDNISQSVVHTLSNPNPNGKFNTGDWQNTTTADYFGWSVDASDSWIVASAPYNLYGNDTGSVYVFNADGGYQREIVGNNTDSGGSNLFGWNVAVSTNYLAVSCSDNHKVVLFNPSNGTRLREIVVNNTDGSFGTAMDIDDTYLVVGQPFKRDQGFQFGGKVFVYRLSNGSLAYEIENPGASVLNDEFGKDVAMNDSIIVVGSPGDTNSSGKVYVFDKGDGSLLHTITNPNVFAGTDPQDKFGYNVALSSKYLLVSAPYEDQFGYTNTGAIYSYDLSDLGSNTPLRQFENPNVFANGEFGYSLAASPDGLYAACSGDIEVGNDIDKVVYHFNVEQFTRYSTLYPGI